jgi:quercetin dioxygenase-like cupin family protein
MMTTSALKNVVVIDSASQLGSSRIIAGENRSSIEGERSVTSEQKETHETRREHEVGILAASLLNFDLNREIEQLRSEGRWQSGHTAKTLVKYSDLRIVLVAIKPGGCLVQHRTEGRISVQTLVGNIRFRAADRTIEVPPGHMLTLEREVPHNVEGIVDSAFLLTIAWPSL